MITDKIDISFSSFFTQMTHRSIAVHNYFQFSVIIRLTYFKYLNILKISKYYIIIYFKSLEIYFNTN